MTATALVLCGASDAARVFAQAREHSVRVQFNRRQTNRLRPGVTFGIRVNGQAQTDNTLTRETLLRATAYQNQHVIGWGGWYTDDGLLDMGRLDEIVRRMPGPQRIITLCCALPSQRVDSGKLESRPRDDAFDDFARMAGDVARRFAGTVTHYQIWNELKGFWSDAADSWDMAAYCRLYQDVYDEVKRADPGALVGGPYITMDVDDPDVRADDHPRRFAAPNGVVDGRSMEAIDRWLKCVSGAHGHLKADFIAVDVRNFNRQGTWRTTPFEANAVFERVAARVRQRLGRRQLPLWAAEWYSAAPPPISRDMAAALQMSGMRSLALGGYSFAPLWYPEGDKDGLHGIAPGLSMIGLWTDAGAAVTPLAGYFQQFREGFPVGSALYPAQAVDGASEVQVLAGEFTTLLINTRAETAALEVNGRRFELAGYEVRFVATAVIRGVGDQ